MSALLLWLLIFVVSLLGLAKASDWFIEAAERISLSLKIPSFVIGITIVALGTSLPELVSSIIAVVDQHSEIVVSNVVGSNIANILFVLGIVAIVGKRMKLDFELKKRDLFFLLSSALLLTITIWDGLFDWKDGILCLLGLFIYLVYTIRRSHKDSKEARGGEKAEQIAWYLVPMLVGSSLLIYLSADYNIQAIIRLSEILQIGPEIIAATVLSIGTSLPELFVSISAVKKGNSEMAVGNILGSNIFNIFAVMGIPALVGNLFIPEIITNFSIVVMLAATALYILIVRDKKMNWKEGVFLLTCYVIFLAYLLIKEGM